MNKSAIIALVAGIFLVIGVQLIETGSIWMLFQPVAFLIVVGGTFCAAVVNFGTNVLIDSLIAAKSIFVKQQDNSEIVIDDIIQIAYYARRNGIFSLETLVDKIDDAFLRRGVKLCVDINNPQFISDILKNEITYEEEQEFISSRVFEALGGYAPTFGIVGAVLGLIHVMSNMQSIEILCSGIATAFVATLYGVGFANLIFLPIAGNLKQRLREKVLLKEVIVQGLISIHMQENPEIIKAKLQAYLKYHNKGLIEQIGSIY